MKKIFLALVLGVLSSAVLAQSINLPTPAGSGVYGISVTVLPNGNYVVTDPGWSSGGIQDMGAVYLYNGKTNALISTLTGSSKNDLVGIDGVVVLTNGNYVVSSSYWNNIPNNSSFAGAVTWGSGTTGVSGAVSIANSLVGGGNAERVGRSDRKKAVVALTNGNYVIASPTWGGVNTSSAGAVTWANGTTGITGYITPANSLVGSGNGNLVGSSGIVALSNGNYVVASYQWDNGSAIDAGAATWGNGATGTVGVVSAANSLIGSKTYDRVGTSDFSNGIIELSNGNYIVRSNYWDNGNIVNAGAVTFGNGTTGVSGVLSAANSLVGSSSDDQVGLYPPTLLSTGGYVVRTFNWRNGNIVNAGAATFGNGTSGVSGPISAANSLVGTSANDQVSGGSPLQGTAVQVVGGGITPLATGAYVVSSGDWRNGSVASAGAVTYCGPNGLSGPVTTANSLVGSQAGDQVGMGGAVVLSTGAYVVSSFNWKNGTFAKAGAATYCSPTGLIGVVSTANSLVGSHASDQVSSSSGYSGAITALPGGAYVVSSPSWDNGSIDSAGASTYCNSTGLTGLVSTANSLVGSQTNDRVGGGVTILSTGAYVINSPVWKNGAATNAGAVTFCGTTGLIGAVSAANSLVGTQANDYVGIYGGVAALPNGAYVVRSERWNNGSVLNAGAATYCGPAGLSGAVSAANSLVGSQADDQVSIGGITVLSNGNYLVRSERWDNGSFTDAGAITLGDGNSGIKGPVTACNSVLGNVAGSPFNGSNLMVAYNNSSETLVVGKPDENTVTLFAPLQSALALTSASAAGNAVGTRPVAFINSACKLITSLKPSGSAPVKGNMQAAVHIQPTTPTTLTNEPYCRRHYSILPADSADFKTAKITLYFTQSEFDDYNAAPGITDKLPQNPTDAAGKTALRVTQQKGTSPTGNFGTFTGFAGSGPANVLVIPGDSNVFWNAPLSRWEVSFPVTGFGGFFLSAGNNAPLSLPAEMALNKGIAVSPVPATNILTITSNPQLAGSTVTALNLHGQVMKTAVLEANTKLEVQSWPAGIYLLKFADGSVVKVVKQ